MKKLRLAFMGTPHFSVPPLRALIDAGHDMTAVYCPPPRPSGRGNKIQKSEVHLFAEENGIEIRTPKTFRDVEEQKKFMALNLDAAIVSVYSLLLPRPILDAPRLGCVNIHPSLLPRWRGAAPIKRALLAGDTETGVTIMKLDEGLDTGPMLLAEKIPISPTATAETLDEELAEIGARLIVQSLEGLANRTIPLIPQPETGATYAAKLSKEDGRIDWAKPAHDIERQIRALHPWPGCFFMLGNEAIKVLSAAVIDQSGPPGTLLDENFTVATGNKALRLQNVQRAGKNPTDGASLLRGLRLPIGHKL